MISLEFATNMFGHIKPEIKKRLERVVNKPNQKNWEDAYSIIINSKGRMLTLWQAVLVVDPFYTRSKPYDKPWDSIPTQETLKKAIQYGVFEYGKENEKLN